MHVCVENECLVGRDYEKKVCTVHVHVHVYLSKVFSTIALAQFSEFPDVKTLKIRLKVSLQHAK